jgi:hypothetical protein
MGEVTQSAESNAKKKTDWDAAKRAVAKSEPPRISDIEAHAKFLQKYGGQTSKFSNTMDMLSCIESRMNPSRIVSGGFFYTIAKLKTPPSEITPRLAHALIITQALGPKEREDVGATITESMVKSLITTNKTMGLKAETILTKAWKIVKEATSGDKGIACIVDLQTKIVMKIFFPDESKYESMDDISKEFVEGIIGMSSSSAEQTSLDVDEVPNAGVSYQADGTNDAGRTTLHNLGFKVKSLIEPKQSDIAQDVQYVIDYINDDGSSGCRRVMPNGDDGKDLTIISMNDMVKNYRHAKKRIEMYSDYPEISARNSDDFTINDMKSAIVIGLRRLSLSKDYKKVDFRVQKYPTSRVFSLTNVPKGELRIVPLTLKVTSVTDGKDGTYTQALVGNEKFQLGRCVTDTTLSEFFVVREVHEVKLANAKLQTFTEKVENMTVKIPCLVNTQDIAKDTEIVLYKPAKNDKRESEVTTNICAVLDAPAPAEKKQKRA